MRSPIAGNRSSYLRDHESARHLTRSWPFGRVQVVHESRRERYLQLKISPRVDYMNSPTNPTTTSWRGWSISDETCEFSTSARRAVLSPPLERQCKKAVTRSALQLQANTCSYMRYPGLFSSGRRAWTSHSDCSIRG